MNRLFNPEAPFWQAIGRIGDVIWLNVLTIAFSWPIITVGASLTALYDCAHQITNDTGGGTTAMFWKSFRSNFAKATLLWLIVSAVLLVLIAWWAFVPAQQLLVVKISLTTVVLLTFPFVWALQARLENTVGHTLKNAALITFARLGWSFSVLAVHIAFVSLVISVTYYLPRQLFILLLLGYPMVAFTSVPLVERAIAPLLRQAESTGRQ